MRSASARWGAAAIDCVVIFAAWFALGITIRDAFIAANPRIGFVPVTMMLGFGYYIALDALGGATIGKLVTGVRVYDINLKRARAPQVALRGLELVPWVILFGLLFAWLQSKYIDENGQGIGDRFSKTFVIKKKEVEAFALAQAPPSV